MEIHVEIGPRREACRVVGRVLKYSSKVKWKQTRTCFLIESSKVTAKYLSFYIQSPKVTWAERYKELKENIDKEQ